MANGIEDRAVALFLRGINVGGRRLENKALTALLTASGAGRAKTIQAAGTAAVLIRPGLDPAAFSRDVADRLAAHMGNAIPFAVRFLPELEAIVTEGSRLAGSEATQLLCILGGLDDVSGPDRAVAMRSGHAELLDELRKRHETIDNMPEETLQAGPACLFWRYPKGRQLEAFGSVLLGPHFARRLTTRNISTLAKTLAALQALTRD